MIQMNLFTKQKQIHRHRKLKVNITKLWLPKGKGGEKETINDI